MFDLLGLGAAMAALLGTDSASGGYIVGAIFTGGIGIAMLMISSKLDAQNGGPILFMVGLGLGLSVVFGWLPVWLLLFCGISMLFGMIGIFGSPKG